jgi:hypothetical protein
MCSLELVQLKFPPEYEVLGNGVGKWIRFIYRRTSRLTQNVRQANISKNLMMLVAFPNQNHADGDFFKLSAATLAAYTKRLVVSAKVSIVH